MEPKDRVCEIAEAIVAVWESGESIIHADLRIALFKAVTRLPKE